MPRERLTPQQYYANFRAFRQRLAAQQAWAKQLSEAERQKLEKELNDLEQYLKTHLEKTHLENSAEEVEQYVLTEQARLNETYRGALTLEIDKLNRPWLYTALSSVFFAALLLMAILAPYLAIAALLVMVGSGISLGALASKFQSKLLAASSLVFIATALLFLILSLLGVLALPFAGPILGFLALVIAIVTAVMEYQERQQIAAAQTNARLLQEWEIEQTEKSEKIQNELQQQATQQAHAKQDAADKQRQEQTQTSSPQGEPEPGEEPITTVQVEAWSEFEFIPEPPPAADTVVSYTQGDQETTNWEGELAEEERGTENSTPLPPQPPEGELATANWMSGNTTELQDTETSEIDLAQTSPEETYVAETNAASGSASTTKATTSPSWTSSSAASSASFSNEGEGEKDDYEQGETHGQKQ